MRSDERFGGCWGRIEGRSKDLSHGKNGREKETSWAAGEGGQWTIQYAACSGMAQQFSCGCARVALRQMRLQPNLSFDSDF